MSKKYKTIKNDISELLDEINERLKNIEKKIYVKPFVVDPNDLDGITKCWSGSNGFVVTNLPYNECPFGVMYPPHEPIQKRYYGSCQYGNFVNETCTYTDFRHCGSTGG